MENHKDLVSNGKVQCVRMMGNHHDWHWEEFKCGFCSVEGAFCLITSGLEF